jgi:hypothetical protein
MTINDLSEPYRVRVKKDSCGEVTAPGTYGHVFEHGPERFGIFLQDHPPARPSRAKALLARRREALAAGFTPSQIGDCESALLFDPTIQAQVKLALKLVGTRKKRQISPEHLQKLMAATQKTRFSRKGTVLGAPSAS